MSVNTNERKNEGRRNTNQNHFSKVETTLQMWEFRVLEKLGLKKNKTVMAVLAVAPHNSPPPHTPEHC